jgi:hypothetical protein
LEENLEDEFDQALKVDILAASLRSDHKQATELLETLGKMLQVAVPESTTIKRGGWFTSKDRPIEELLVKFEEAHYQIIKGKHNSFTARVSKLVRGVVLKTSDTSLDKCIEGILAELSNLAEGNSEARRALNRFVHG